MSPLPSELLSDVMFHAAIRVHSGCGRAYSIFPGSAVLRGISGGAVWSTPLGAAGDTYAGFASASLVRARLLVSSTAVLARFAVRDWGDMLGTRSRRVARRNIRRVLSAD